MKETVKESLNKSSSAEQRIFSSIRAASKAGNTYSIPPLLNPSAREKSLAVGSCRFNQSFLRNSIPGSIPWIWKSRKFFLDNLFRPRYNVQVPHGPVAQLGERSVRIREVESSSLFRSTKAGLHFCKPAFYCKEKPPAMPGSI